MRYKYNKFYILFSLIIFLLIILLTGCVPPAGSSGGGSDGGGIIYTVSYDGNGNTDGSTPSPAGYAINSTVTAAENSGNLLRINVSGVSYKFDNWNTKANGTGIDYEAGTGTFTITSNITLYAQWVPYSVQDVGPAGGYIFYDKGDYTDGWRYMEAATEDFFNGIGYSWGTDGVDVGADGYALGDGHINTINIVINDPASDTAADRCVNYSINNGGIIFDDWYLPSDDELILMYSVLYLNGLGDFIGDIYWSSSEISALAARGRDFVDGSAYNATKNNTVRIRAHRTF